jgi:hypothetical protein
LLDFDARSTLLGEITTPLEEPFFPSGRRPNTPILIRSNDKARFAQVFGDVDVEREGVGSPVVNEDRPDLIGKPVPGLPVPADPFVEFALQVNGLASAVCVVLLVDLLVLPAPAGR